MGEDGRIAEATITLTTVFFPTGANLHTQDGNQIDESQEMLFENVLRRISIQAFDALLACGVRDLMRFIQLTAEDLRQAGISARITTELMGVQQQHLEQMKSGRQNNEAAVIDPLMKEQQ